MMVWLAAVKTNSHSENKMANVRARESDRRGTGCSLERQWAGSPAEGKSSDRLPSRAMQSLFTGPSPESRGGNDSVTRW
jgi:hypothetical protein